MAKKKKKSSLVLLMIAMILMLAAYLLVVKINDQKNSKEQAQEDTTINLIKMDKDSISKIEYTNALSKMSLVKENNVWVNQEDNNIPLNQSYIESMLTSVSSLTSTRLVSKKNNNMKEFGLDKPAIQIVITNKDGKNTTINIGDKVLTGEEYYINLNGESSVYTVSSTIYTSFNYSKEQMIALETMPTITSSQITKVSIDNKTKDDFLVTYEDSNNSSSDVNHYFIKKPYKTNVIGDTNKLNEYFNNFTSISLSECVDYEGKNLKKYGLDAPYSTIDIGYYEKKTEDVDSSKDKTNSTKESTGKSDNEKDTSTSGTTNDTSKEVRVDHEFKLLVGNKKGDSYFVKTGDSKAIYLMSADTLDQMIQVKPFDYILKNINLTNIDTLDSMVIKADGNTYALSINREKTVDKENKEVTKTTYYCNNKEVDEKNFKAVYEAFLSVTNEAESKENVKDAKGVVLITLNRSTKENNKTQIKFIPYDDTFYLVDDNGSKQFLTSIRPVEDFVDALKDLNK